MNKKTKEAVAYLFFGGITTVASIAVYQILIMRGCSSGVSNTISTIVGILVAYITNKMWVFNSRDLSPIIIIMELTSFISGRLFTYLLETALLVFFVDIKGYNSFICKIITNVIVIVLNYFISKKFVFNACLTNSKCPHNK